MTPIPVLLYHRVDNSGGDYVTTPEEFGRHLSWLDDQGFQSLTTAELDRILADPTAARPERPVMLTFDDGFSCLETEVAPALRAHGFTGTGFLITNSVAEDGPGTDRGANLGWAAARSLAAEGVLEFHTHTHTHQKWTFGPGEVATVVEELATSRGLLSDRLGEPESTFDHVAWPFGRACDEWEVAAEQLGMRTQYVVQRGAIDRRGLTRRLPRLLADGMSTSALATWMRVLAKPAGARIGNRVFGSIRHVRHGAAYQ